jgi:hypothetical protein
MSLEQWLANSWIKRLSPSAEDVGDLLAIADRELSDASLQGISIDGRFTHAYDAVRCLAEAALHASGYDVPKGSQQHERMIESLRFTVPANVPGNVDYFDRCRRLRHQAMYVRTGMLQQRDADELLAAAQGLRVEIGRWLRSKYPGLVAE